MKYPINHSTMNAGQHAATIARLKFQGLERGLVPTAASETATVCFIKFKGRTYAVTARHVIETLNGLAEREGNQFEGYSCVQSPGVAINGPFLTPPANYPSPEPDIAICPVREELPGFINKTPFDVRPEEDAKWPISHAVAVGFPTAAKCDVKSEDGSIRLALPCVHAVAEGINSTGSSDQVQFHSELSERPTLVSLSGMSGGPVFWSDDTNHGLVGFVKEALDVAPKQGEVTFYTEPKVNFICQRVDFAIFERWAQYVDMNWQKERNKLNVMLK